MPKSSKQKPILMRGSIVVLRRKCGKTNCHCAQGEPHETWALSYSLKGRTKMLTLRPKDLPLVKAALTRYEKALTKLNQEALKGIESLREKIKKEKEQT